MKRCIRPSECLRLAVDVIALLALPLLALAQDAPPPAFGQPAAAAPANTVNCFDYYHFGSVQVDVTASVASAVSGGFGRAHPADGSRFRDILLTSA